MTTAIAARIIDSSRTLISGIGDNAAYTLVAGDSGKIVIAAAAQDDDDEFRTGNSHSIEYRASGATTFLSLPTSGTAAVPRIDTANTTLSNNTNVSNANRRVATGPSGGQSFVASGKEFVTAQSLNYGARCRDDFTEAQFAIDFSLCGSGTAWEFRTRWEDDAGATTNGTCPTVTTASASSTTHSLADTDETITVTSTQVITAVQTHGLSDTDESIAPTATSSAITSSKIHRLSDSSNAAGFTRTNRIKAVQTHSLSHSETVTLSVSGVITAGSEHSLSGTGSVVVSSIGVLSTDVTHSLSHAETITPTATAVITGIRAHSLSSSPAAISPSVAATLTADQTHNLSHAETITVSSTEVITSNKIHSLSDHSNAAGFTRTNRITAKQTHSLAHSETITPTATSVITETETHSLAHADTITPTATSVITAVRVHNLSHSETITPTATNADITSQSFVSHSLSHSETITPTVAATLTADQTHDLSHAETITPTASTEVITSNKIHSLSDSRNAAGFTRTNRIKAVQTHSLTHSETITPTAEGVISAKSEHSLSGSGSPVVSSIGVLSAGTTHSLSHAGTVEPTATTAHITAEQVHGLVSAPPAIEPTAVGSLSVTSVHSLASSVEITPTADAELYAAQEHSLADSATIPSLTAVAEISSRNIHSLSHARPEITITEIGELTAVQTHTLIFSGTVGASAAAENIRAGIFVSLSGAASIQELVDEAWIAAATYVVNVTIDGLGDTPGIPLKRSEIMSLEEVWNTGLTQLGVGTVDSAANDQTAQAILLRRVWDNFRKQFVSDHAWNGCKTTAALTALANSDFKDTSRWGNVFSLPSDYLRALTVNGHPNQAGNAERIMWEIEIVSDTSGNKSRCICTNQNTAKLEYVFDPGDANIGTFLAPAMKHALGLAFAAFVAPNFGKSANDIALIEQKARDALLKARGIDGQESSGIFFGPSELVESRYRSSS